MFLELARTKLDIFKISKSFVLCFYTETKNFPSEEKFGIIQQIRRAALCAHLNIAEGCTRKSAMERERFYEISGGSIIGIDTALELNYTTMEKLKELGQFMVRSFQMISKMIS